MSRPFALSLCIAMLCCAATSSVSASEQEAGRQVTGDVLLIERSRTADRTMELPRRGLGMAEVERRYGTPNRKHAPVGGNRPQHPPITRWTYPEFSVYFEHSTVIDAVANRLDAEVGVKPPPGGPAPQH